MNSTKYLKQNIDDECKKQNNIIDTHSENKGEYFSLKEEYS